MDLVVDAGNTEIAIGIGAGGPSWPYHWRIQTASGRTEDEYALVLAGLARSQGLPDYAVDAITISSVVPDVTATLAAACTRVFGPRPTVVGPGTKTGMKVAYRTEASLGTDRLVDAVGARDAHGAPVVVVDFGTATTFNVVNAAGEFAGGAIAPGVGIAAAALAASGARLRRIDLQPAGGLPVIGRNTEQAMRAGTLYGYAGLVSGLLQRMVDELGLEPEPAVVATGGLAPAIIPLLDRPVIHAPYLTLDGLLVIARLNR